MNITYSALPTLRFSSENCTLTFTLYFMLLKNHGRKRDVTFSPLKGTLSLVLVSLKTISSIHKLWWKLFSYSWGFLFLKDYFLFNHYYYYFNLFVLKIEFQFQVLLHLVMIMHSESNYFRCLRANTLTPRSISLFCWHFYYPISSSLFLS